MRRVDLTLAAVLALSLGGCARGAVLQGRIDGIRDVVDQAERNGAYRCAPRELAVARANLDFAETELAQGNPSRAEDHFSIAEPNAHAAFRLSPAARCAPRGVVRNACPDPDDDGICGAADRCPNEPEDMDGFEDEDGCPESQDTDGDGIDDLRDACVAEPEDADQYLDQDGCPELDNDVDSLLDPNDRCPIEPEDRDGFQDDDGCPDRDNDSDNILDINDRCPNEPGPESEQGCPRVYQDVQVTGSHIRIMQQIFFDFDSARIQPRSFPILNTVAQVLRDYPTITVEVQGHTDSRGEDDYNMRLSHARAESVRNYLIQQNIAANRLTFQGYGETRAIDSNRTSRGRANNRRVEFVRTDAGATANPTSPPQGGQPQQPQQPGPQPQQGR